MESGVGLLAGCGTATGRGPWPRPCARTQSGLRPGRRGQSAGGRSRGGCVDHAAQQRPGGAREVQDGRAGHPGWGRRREQGGGLPGAAWSRGRGTVVASAAFPLAGRRPLPPPPPPPSCRKAGAPLGACASDSARAWGPGGGGKLSHGRMVTDAGTAPAPGPGMDPPPGILSNPPRDHALSPWTPHCPGVPARAPSLLDRPRNASDPRQPPPFPPLPPARAPACPGAVSVYSLI